MVHYAPKKTCNNTSIINHLGINNNNEQNVINFLYFYLKNSIFRGRKNKFLLI